MAERCPRPPCWWRWLPTGSANMPGDDVAAGLEPADCPGLHHRPVDQFGWLPQRHQVRSGVVGQRDWCAQDTDPGGRCGCRQHGRDFTWCTPCVVGRWLPAATGQVLTLSRVGGTVRQQIRVRGRRCRAPVTVAFGDGLGDGGHPLVAAAASSPAALCSRHTALRALRRCSGRSAGHRRVGE